MVMTENPVAVIGAGPLGIGGSSASDGARRNLRWCWKRSPGRRRRSGEGGHVRLFSAWSELVDPAAARLLGYRLDGTGGGIPDRRRVDREDTWRRWHTRSVTGCATAPGWSACHGRAGTG